MALGWLKLSRSFDLWRWRKFPATVSAWLWLLTHADDAGKAPWAETRIALDCGITRKETRTAKKRLTTSPAEIDIFTAEDGAKYAQILNWQHYQGKPEKAGPQKGHERATDGPDKGRERATKELTQYLINKRLAIVDK